MRFAYNTLVYGDEPIEKGIARIARSGYDGVELVGEPQKLNGKQINQFLNYHKIQASSICSIFDKSRDLVHPDSKIRENGISYVKAVIDLAQEVGSKIVIVRPSPCMKTNPQASEEQEWEWAVENIKKCGQYAAEKNTILVIEAWNRYETYFINRLDQAMALCEDVNSENVGVMGDTFHMNIEEYDMAEAIRSCGGRLKHIHLADSNRAAPGRGHIDFRPIIQAIKDIQYEGYLSFELLPAAADPFRVLKSGSASEFFDQYTQEAIATIKSLF